MRWTVPQLADATGGTAPRPSDVAVTAVTIDSRTAARGSLFVPIVAERDGHDFIGAAIGAGAAAFVCSRPFHHDGAVGIEVPDTTSALADIGRAARRRLEGAAVVGITGSMGKTSTKDLCAAACAGRRVTASERSFNNELGVPLTLANAPDDAEVAIIEMGARGIGHIAMLCAVARPTVAVVTAVAAVHTEFFGSIDGVAQGKGELVEALPASGLAVLNGDDARVSAMASRTSAPVLRYGVTDGALDVVASDVTVDDDLRPSFTVRSPWGSCLVRLGVRGEHQVGNALAALCVACSAGIPLDDAAAGLATAALSPWRMELSVAPSGLRVLNDAYNANQASMEAALRSLAALPNLRRRVAVLGEMAELADPVPAHRSVAELASSLDVTVVPVATALYGGTPASSLDGAHARLVAMGLGDGDGLLCKGSRVVGLERLAARLLAGPPGAGATPACDG